MHIVFHTLGRRNSAPPRMVETYKDWEKPPINWCRMFAIHFSRCLLSNS